MLRKISPIQLLLIGFVLLAIVGGLLLMLPSMNSNREWQPFVDALFMSTSAVTTTGLGVVAIGEDYNIAGQLIILVLIQIGGLGYMTLIVFIMQIFGQSLSLHGGSLMEESLAVPSRGEMREFIMRVVLFTLLFEGVGALALTLHWLPEYSVGRAVYFGVFHSISAFCTAGFALFGSGFVAYQTDAYFNIVISLISTSGAVGFFVLSEARVMLRKLRHRQQIRRITMHSKLAIIVTSGLIFLATAVYFFAEPNSNNNLWHHFLAASFQGITAVSTTGFNTVDLSHLQPVTQFLLVALMIVGAPAGGTGGGIKSTTFGVLLLLVWSLLRNHRNVKAFGRRLSNGTIIKSMSIFMVAILWLTFSILVLAVTETAVSANSVQAVSFLDLLFEAASALGTVGISTGITSQLSQIGRIVLIISMMIGRVGPLAFAVSLFGKHNRTILYQYPQEDVFVG